jgi:hypothetical protein
MVVKLLGVAVNYRENKQTRLKGNYASDTGSSAPRSEQETFSNEEPTASSTVEKNKVNV